MKDFFWKIELWFRLNILKQWTIKRRVISIDELKKEYGDKLGEER